MNVAVRFLSYSGNTKKIADAVAHAVGTEALPLDSPLTERADILFLGSSLYKFGADPAIGRFLADNAGKIGKIALFGTSASGGSTYRQVAALAKQYGIPLCEKEFVCLGKFLFMHKNRPNAQDEHDATAFAKDIIGA